MQTRQLLSDGFDAHLKKTKVTDWLVGQCSEYKKEKGVKKGSKTPTFAVLKLRIGNKRWRDVDFFIKAGKYLDKREAKIVIKFKMVECLLAKSCPSDSNYLTINIQPNEGIVIEINGKVPGENQLIKPIKMEFCHSCTFGPNTPEAYENLLRQVMIGDHSVFTRNDEIEQEWKIVEPMLKAKKKLNIYKKGSKGPKELVLFNKKHNMRWK